MTRHSLRLRLLVGAAVAVFVALAFAWLAMTLLFQRHLEIRVEQELRQGRLREVRVKELSMERKIRLVYPARRALSHAARAFLELIKAV